MTAASPGNALLPSKTPSMPLLASDSVWHYSERRKQLNHLIKEPPCSCGAGPDTFSFIYEDSAVETDQLDSISDSLIPNEYKLFRHPGVLGLEPVEDRYSVRTKQHPDHMTVFPSLKPVSRKEVVLLRHTMHDMLLKLRREREKHQTASPQTHLHELMDVVKKEQEIYNTVFHEIIRQVSSILVLTEHGRRVTIISNIQNDLFTWKFTNFERKLSILFTFFKLKISQIRHLSRPYSVKLVVHFSNNGFLTNIARNTVVFGYSNSCSSKKNGFKLSVLEVCIIRIVYVPLRVYYTVDFGY